LVVKKEPIHAMELAKITQRKWNLMKLSERRGLKTYKEEKQCTHRLFSEEQGNF
jgi:hypothetical protein